jgi:hypothetical protein
LKDNLDVIFEYLDRLDTGLIDVDLFLEYLVPRLSDLKKNILKAMYYTIQSNLGLIGIVAFF